MKTIAATLLLGLAAGCVPGPMSLTAVTPRPVGATLSCAADKMTVLGYNVSNRDRIVSQSLSVQQFPQATFKADPFAVPAGLEAGQTVTLTVPGQLTIHGVTRAVTAKIDTELNGTSVQAKGTIATVMTDFGITPPQVGITVVQPQVTIEFLLDLTQTT